jgi:hypothetical protein
MMTNRAQEQTRIDGEHDRRYDDNGQGKVTDAAHDGRLKENREAGVSMQDRDSDTKSTAKKK